MSDLDILVLEDDPVRHIAFKKQLTGSNYVIVETAQEAIDQLREKTWDCLFLDHDLGGRVYEDSGDGTGYEVAEWLSERPEKQPGCIIIHSLNPVGADNMHNKLPKSLKVPFAWTKINLELSK